MATICVILGLWRNACALRIVDDRLWDAVDAAWGSLYDDGVFHLKYLVYTECVYKLKADFSASETFRLAIYTTVPEYYFLLIPTIDRFSYTNLPASAIDDNLFVVLPTLSIHFRACLTFLTPLLSGLFYHYPIHIDFTSQLLYVFPSAQIEVQAQSIVLQDLCASSTRSFPCCISSIQ
jgi:hypothetical protein